MPWKTQEPPRVTGWYSVSGGPLGRRAYICFPAAHEGELLCFDSESGQIVSSTDPRFVGAEWEGPFASRTDALAGLGSATRRRTA